MQSFGGGKTQMVDEKLLIRQTFHQAQTQVSADGTFGNGEVKDFETPVVRGGADSEYMRFDGRFALCRFKKNKDEKSGNWCLCIEGDGVLFTGFDGEFVLIDVLEIVFVALCCQGAFFHT